MKKLFVILLLAVFAGNIANAQTPATEDAYYSQVDKSPEFPGGISKLYSYINKNLKYPEEAIKANIRGKVWAQLIIEKDGSINNVLILKGIGFGCDEEVERIFKAMPKWNPGMREGQAVRTNYRMPISFILEGKKAK